MDRKAAIDAGQMGAVREVERLRASEDTNFDILARDLLATRGTEAVYQEEDTQISG